MNRSLFSESYWGLTKSQKNKYQFNNNQMQEIFKWRQDHKTPKEIAEFLGCGVYKVHKIVNFIKKQNPDNNIIESEENKSKAEAPIKLSKKELKKKAKEEKKKLKEEKKKLREEIRKKNEEKKREELKNILKEEIMNEIKDEIMNYIKEKVNELIEKK